MNNSSKYFFKIIGSIGSYVCRDGWFSLIPSLIFLYIFIFPIIAFLSSLQLPKQYASWDLFVGDLIPVLLITFLVWLIFFILIAVGVYIKKFKIPFELLKNHQMRKKANFPGINAVGDLWKCLMQGDFDHALTVARLQIELSIWKSSIPESQNKTNDIEKFIKNYIRQHEIRGNNDLDSADELSIENCFVLQENREWIENYFSILSEMEMKNKDRFLTEAIIQQGYLAPQYLLAGLMSEYKDDWKPIIEAFFKESQIKSWTPLGDKFLLLKKFRRIQMFTFTCWLMWGPSIPIGNCDRWTKREEDNSDSLIALQYGFGDENNSFPLLPLIKGNNRDQSPSYKDLFEYVTKGPFAFRASIKVRPMWITTFIQNQNEKKISHVQRQIREPREKSDKSIPGNIVLNYAPHEGLTSLPDNYHLSEKQDFYSSYVWVMFELYDRKKNEPCFPLPLTGSGSFQSIVINKETDGVKYRPWLGLIPFFEHGNIADDVTYATYKNQLANKALSTIERLFTDEFKENFILRYACASDDSNCAHCRDKSNDNKFLSSIKIRDNIKRLIDNSDSYNPNRFNNLQDCIILDSKNNKPNESLIINSCMLPDLIDYFYNTMNIEKKNS